VVDSRRVDEAGIRHWDGGAEARRRGGSKAWWRNFCRRIVYCFSEMLSGQRLQNFSQERFDLSALDLAQDGIDDFLHGRALIPEVHQRGEHIVADIAGVNGGMRCGRS